MRRATVSAKRSLGALHVLVALALLIAGSPLLACDPRPVKSDHTEKAAAPPDSAPATATERDRELVKQRMRLCQQRPEICMQQAENKAAEAPHPPTEGQVGK
jgi:hypothetical protein